MANFAVPGTWTHDGNNGQDQSVFYVTASHTTTENYLIIFDRKKISPVNGGFTNPSFRTRVIRSHVDADSLPLPKKSIIDTQMSWHPSAPAADVKAMVTVNGALWSDVNLPADIVDLIRIPLAA